MAKSTVFKNISRGPRGVRTADGELRMIDPGASVSIDGDISAEELKLAKDSGDFELGGEADAQPEQPEDSGDPPKPEDIIDPAATAAGLTDDDTAAPRGRGGRRG